MSQDSLHLQSAFRYCRLLHPQIRISQLELLLAIHNRPGLSQIDLANECDLSPSGVSRAIDALGASGRKDRLSEVAMNWVETSTDPSDDRVKLVSLNDEGHEFVEHLLGLCFESQQQPPVQLMREPAVLEALAQLQQATAHLSGVLKALAEQT